MLNLVFYYEYFNGVNQKIDFIGLFVSVSVVNINIGKVIFSFKILQMDEWK